MIQNKFRPWLASGCILFVRSPTFPASPTQNTGTAPAVVETKRPQVGGKKKKPPPGGGGGGAFFFPRPPKEAPRIPNGFGIGLQARRINVRRTLYFFPHQSRLSFQAPKPWARGRYHCKPARRYFRPGSVPLHDTATGQGA